MKTEERAKQFMPFSALKGLSEALAKKELPTEERVCLSEDAAEELNNALLSLKNGDEITAEYYDGERYRRVRGSVSRFDEILRLLKIDGMTVRFRDIRRVEKNRDKLYNDNVGEAENGF